MFILFNKDTRIIETDYRDKPYFSDHQAFMTLKDKCFVCSLTLLGLFFTVHMLDHSVLIGLIH